MSTIPEAVAAALGAAGGAVLVGFSGGLDSTVLLHAAARLRPVTALHVNHSLHPDADAWQRHCERVTQALQVPLLSRTVSVPRHGSLEAQARSARYDVFIELLPPGGRLLLAHHRGDQAETVLLRLLQGRGLYGMPEARPLGAGLLVRPLLQLARGDLEAYAANHRLQWVEDPSNRDTALDRNFLRHEVLPRLRARWRDVDGALLAALSRGRLADELLAARLGDIAGSDSLAVVELDAFGADEQVELLRLWLAARGYPAPRRAALQEFVRQLAATGDRAPQLQLGLARLRRHQGRVHLLRPQPALQAEYPLTAPGVLRLPHGVLRVVAVVDGFVPQGDLQVRFRQGGERLCSGGHHRSLKQLFHEAGVAPWLRPGFPLLYDALGLVAVPGLAQRDRPPDAAFAAGATAWRAEWRPGG